MNPSTYTPAHIFPNSGHALMHDHDWHPACHHHHHLAKGTQFVGAAAYKPFFGDARPSPGTKPNQKKSYS